MRPLIILGVSELLRALAVHKAGQSSELLQEGEAGVTRPIEVSFLRI